MDDEGIQNHIFDMINEVNGVVGWNYDLRGIESPQYTVYESGNYYDWHVDQHPRPIRGVVRKISMTLFMSEPEEYEGGEFDLEIYKPGTNPVSYTHLTLPTSDLV